jgi:hypothetical protein
MIYKRFSIQNLKRQFLCFVFIAFGIGHACGQFLYVGEPKAEIEKKFWADTDYLVDGYQIINSPDTLAFIADPEGYPMECYYFMNEDSICSSQIIKIYCSVCAEEYLKRIIKAKKFKFKRLNNNYYFSKRDKNLFMRVIKDEDYEVCIKIIINYSDWTKEEYKALERKAKTFKKLDKS